MEITEQIKKFQEFYEENYYAELLEKIRKNEKFINIDFSKLSNFDPELAEFLLDKPEEVISAAQLAIENFESNARNFKIRFFGLPASQHIFVSNIRSAHLGKLLQMEGIVRQKTDVRPQVTSARFECPSCGNIIGVLQVDSKFREPTTCGCGRKGKFRLISKELVDAQKIVLEEDPEKLDGGAQPKRMDIFLKEDLVSPLTNKKTNPGTKIRVVGFLKEVPIIGKDGGKLTRFDLMIEANHVEPVQEEFVNLMITKEEKEKIKELSRDPKLFPKLIQSIAPSIFGHDKVKEALILQLVGGVRKERKDGIVTRGDMHLLLIGDPGSGKSQLLKRATAVAPKARYVSGKGASGAGLTAAVVRDEFLKGWALEAGALVLANKGFCISGDTEILMHDGKVKTIKDIYQDYGKEDQKVLFFDTSKLKTRVADIINTSKRIPQKLLKITFNTGDELKITPEHLVPIWDNKIIWKKTGDLAVGEYLISSRDFEFSNKKTNGSLEISNDLCEFLGMVLTDGHLSNKKYVIRYYTKDIKLKKRFIKLASSLFKKKCSTYVDKRSGILQIFFCSKKIHLFLQSWGIKKGNKSKYNPNLSRIYNLPKEKIKSFIVGVINGDGSISNRNSGGIVDIVCGNEVLAGYYRKILRKMGVVSKISKINSNGGGIVKNGEYIVYKVSITGIDNIKELYDKRLMNRKLIELDKIIKRKNLSSSIPNIFHIFNMIRIILPHSKKAVLYKNSIKTSFLKKGFGIKKETLKKVLKKLNVFEQIKNFDDFKILKKIAKNKVLFPKIEKIEEIPVEEVYDIQTNVKNDPNFFANFISVHNCMIDELDKMGVDDRAAMHEALEQQTVTISKANIQATLRAETAVLAAANPKWGRFDVYETVAKQIDLPSTLINRFDLIFPIKDLPDKERDETMAKFILNLHQDGNTLNPEIDNDLLRKYIAYARQNFSPVLTDSALEAIKDYYVKMRTSSSEGESGKRSITISARQLEALVRLAEASARARLSNKVTKRDSNRAIELVHFCLTQVGIDPETGQIDIDRISTGIASSERNKILQVKEIIDDLENRIGKTIPIDDLIKECIERGVEEDKVEEVIDKLKRSGDIFEPRRGFIQKI